MAIIDLTTGEETTQKPVVPAGFEPAPVESIGGVIDLNTGEPLQQQAQQEQLAPQEPEMQLAEGLTSDGPLDPIIDTFADPATQMFGGTVAAAVGGLEMLGRAPFSGWEEALKEGQKTQQTIGDFFAPQTEAGIESTALLKEALLYGRKIPAGWGAISELIETQDIDEAKAVLANIEKKGMAEHFAELNYKAYESPIMAALVKSSGDIAAAFFATKGVINKGQLNKAKKDLEIIDEIQKGDSSRKLAEYKLKNRDGWHEPTKAEVTILAEKLGSDRDFAIKMAREMPTLDKKKSFKSAVGQEWDQSLLGLIQASSKSDVTVMERMLKIYDDARDNMALKSDSRPIFESGQSISEGVSFLLDKKKDAGRRVGKAAQDLRGVDVDYAPAVDSFIGKLIDDGVVINNGRPVTNVRQYRNIDFRNSPYFGSPQSEKLLRNQMKRLTELDFGLDGFNLHTVKQNLPSQITTAKKSEGGLVPKAELLLNDLRRDINESLRGASSDYKTANDDFRQVIEPLNKFNENVPANARVDWDGVNTKNAGLQVRKILTNYANGQDLAEAVKGIYKTSNDLGANLSGDAIKQAFFAIGLDKRLGAYADASMQGITQSAGSVNMGSLPTGAVDLGLKTVGAAMRKLKRVDDDKAIQAMRDYLKESKQGKK